MAYRWFLGLGLTDKVMDASTFSQYRQRRFLDRAIEQHIFDAMVQQAMQHGLIRGEVLYTDSTHLKAHANKNKWEVQTLTQTPLAYLSELERAVSEDRQAHDKPALKASTKTPETREIKTSTTDPESGYMTREGKPQGLFYLDHRTVDG